MELSIVVPMYNEEANIMPLLDSLIAFREIRRLDWEIIIVDDGSSDATGRIADGYSREHKNIQVIHRDKGKRGMGLALKDGTRLAKGVMVAWVMGDRADDLTTLSEMVKKLRKGHDIVFGSRYMKGGSRGNLGRFKAFLSSRFTVLARWIFGIPVHDITNAFRAFRKTVFDEVPLECDDFAISPEQAIKAYLLNFKLGEVPTTYFDRRAGQTKFEMGRMVFRYLRLLRYKFIKMTK